MIEMSDNLAKWWIETPALLKRENEVGGDLVDLPCPFCKKPRSQRSTYVRCQPCGMNWFAGQPIDKHPHSKTVKPYVADVD